MIRLLIAACLIATIAACDATPTPPAPPPPLTARIALPYAVVWRHPGVDRPSLAAYPAPVTEEPGGATAYP